MKYLATTTALTLLLGSTAQAQTVEELLAAAQGEPPLTVYDSTGKIEDMAEAFSALYGLEVIGDKVAANVQVEMVVREAQAGNVIGDVMMLTDAPSALATLIPNGFVQSWLPPDMVDVIPAQYQNPLTVTTNANIWAYNTEVYDSCPVSNLWELTQPEWQGRVAITDPLRKSIHTDWFNQMATYGNDAMAQAYLDLNGTALVTDEANVASAWIAAFAANGPLLTEGDDEISEAVGAPGQTEPFFGLMSSAKWRDIADEGYMLAACPDLAPYPGWTYTKLALIASGTDSPNTARLFVHYVLTAEGIAPQTNDGKVSTNTTIMPPADEPSGLAGFFDRLEQYDNASALSDYDTRQDWQDFWRTRYVRG